MTALKGRNEKQENMCKENSHKEDKNKKLPAMDISVFPRKKPLKMLCYVTLC